MPLAAPVTVGPFTVVVWPNGQPLRGVSEVDRARALLALERSWTDLMLELPSLEDNLERALSVARGNVPSVVLDDRHRAVLIDELRRGRDIVVRHRQSDVLHGEPHDGNYLSHRGKVVVIDFEAGCRGPIEWDAAHFSNEVAAAVWPEIDLGLVRDLRRAISASVSAFCWSHVARHPADSEMRWHAQHHLDQLITNTALRR